ncbi:uncharacterized protein [Arachis hypogaea]|uniref:uncharacterized protein n=4 Tax=Arachis hypogaea TaxID=3818 RepID=UPI003B20D707
MAFVFKVYKREFSPIPDEKMWPPWYSTRLKPNPAMRRKASGRPQCSENRTGPVGSTGLTANRRCRRSGPPAETVLERTGDEPANRPKTGRLGRTGNRPLQILFLGNLVCSSISQFLVVDSINQEATADNNDSVNNNMPADTPISNDAANPNSRSANDSQSQGSSNLRGKIDLAWKYVALQTVNGKPQYQCLFCLQVFNGGGIHRMKKHLAKVTGDVKKCPKVPYDVEKQMESLLKDIQANKKKRKVSFGEEGGDEVEDAIDEAIQEEQEQQRTSNQQGVGGDPKKKAKVIPPMFAPRTTPGAQPSIKSALQNKEAIHEVDKRFARWLLDCKIPFNAVMSPYFQDMLDGVAGIGPGYKGPSYDKLRVHLLADLKRESQMLVDSYRSAWKKTGCTLMAHISNLATRASKITVFVYNHTVFLSWLRERPKWREIVRPGATRFATVFITLKSIFDRKKELQQLVVDSIFTDHKLGRSATGRAVSAIILDAKFWDDCFTVCKLVSPLIYLLRVVDADDPPSLGYVYEGMLRAEDAIKEMFRQSKTAYQPYTDIINSRWDKHLKKDLHAAAYFLNPKFFFNENYKEAPDVMRGLLDLVTLYCKCNNLDSVQAMKEIHLYRDRKESFDRQEVIPAASELKPDEWWRLFGGSAPCLQKIAVRILSQASASSGCERNWSLFDQIHTKRRNRLEHDRLNDIVYVTYNLRLKSRKEKEKRKQKTQHDPIDYESISQVDFWVTEEVVEKEPDLPSNVDDLLREIDADLYQSGGGSSGLYAASLSSADQGGNEGEDHPTEADLQQVLADFDN